MAKRELNEIIRDLNQNASKRDALDKRYWRRSEELTDEFEKLMKELDDH